MGPETPLRIAGPADLAPVTRLIAGFRDFLADGSPTNAEIEATVSTLLRDRSTEFLLIGDPEVGFVQTRFRLSVWTGTEDAWLEDLFVEEAARGEGHGRTLVEAAVERARSRGCGGSMKALIGLTRRSRSRKGVMLALNATPFVWFRAPW